MFPRILDIAHKEILQLRRDRRMLPMIMIAPVLQLIIYGYAISTTISNIPTAVYDASHTPASRELISEIRSSGYFTIHYYPSALRQIDTLMDDGDATVSLVIPPDFSKNLSRRVPAPVQLIVDGSDPNSATTALGYLQAIFRGYSQDILTERFSRLPQVGVDPRIRVWYNPTLESRNYMVPGIIALIMLQITMNLTTFSIVRERERGTIEQLIVTPIRRYELIIGKVLPYAAVGYIDVFLVLLVGTQVFRVPVMGSLALLLLLSGLFLMAALGTGLFISSVSRNQQQATMAIFFVMFPNFLLSGFFYPIANMPRFIQWVTYIIPLRYYLAIVRGVFLKGAGLTLMWDQVLPMAALGIIILTLSVFSFHKRL
jgi:ABC-2 type transport system permease protein